MEESLTDFFRVLIALGVVCILILFGLFPKIFTDESPHERNAIAVGSGTDSAEYQTITVSDRNQPVLTRNDFVDEEDYKKYAGNLSINEEMTYGVAGDDKSENIKKQKTPVEELLFKKLTESRDNSENSVKKPNSEDSAKKLNSEDSVKKPKKQYKKQTISILDEFKRLVNTQSADVELDDDLGIKNNTENDGTMDSDQEHAVAQLLEGELLEGKSPQRETLETDHETILSILKSSWDMQRIK